MLLNYVPTLCQGKRQQGQHQVYHLLEKRTNTYHSCQISMQETHE